MEEAMIVIERMVQQIFPDKWAELERIDKKYNQVEARLGFPSKKRLRALIGVHPAGSLVIEREWPSLAAFEAANEKGLMDPEYQALQQESGSIIKSYHWEILMPIG
jgi:hypothetical protein